MPQYLNKDELIGFLKSRRYTAQNKNGGYELYLSPTVIDEIQEMEGVFISDK